MLDAVRWRLAGHVPVRRPDRSAAGLPTDRLPGLHTYFVDDRGCALSLPAVRHNRVRRLRGIYVWVPKMTGRMMDQTLSKVDFWLTFAGFHTTFLIQHWLGAEGMPRHYADHLPTDGFIILNTISSITH
jgi:Cytochrome C and Quinol oxidase polypeptide I